MNVLFICSQNMLRSPTAEKTFADYPGLTARSAGTAEDAEKPVTAEMIEWAEMIFVMEELHHRLLHERFSPLLEGKPVVILQIRDDFEYMDPELVEILKAKVPPHLPGSSGEPAGQGSSV